MADRPSRLALDRAAPVAASFWRAGCTLMPEPFLGAAKLQLLGDAATADIAGILGAPLPAPLREIAIGRLHCAWLGPAAWLLTGVEAEVAALAARCRDAAGDRGLILDLGAAIAAFLLSGPGARDALAAHCPLDFSDAAMPVGTAARSLLGEARLILSRRPDAAEGTPVFRLIVDQTMADYAIRMLSEPADGRRAIASRIESSDDSQSALESDSLTRNRPVPSY